MIFETLVLVNKTAEKKGEEETISGDINGHMDIKLAENYTTILLLLSQSKHSVNEKILQPV